MNFSIINIVTKAFESYRRNWGLVVLAAALSSSPLLLRPLLSPINYVKADQNVIKTLFESEKDPLIIEKKLKEYGQLLNDETERKLPWDRVLTLLLFLASLFLHLGVIKICLELVDSGKSSIKTLFSQADRFLVAVGAGAFVVGFGGIAAILTILFYRFFASTMVVFLLLIPIITPFIFYLWCLVDKKTGVIESFTCSFKKVEKQFMRVLLFCILIVMMTTLLNYSLQSFFNLCFDLISLPLYFRYFALSHFFAASLSMPFINLMLTYAYRSLQKKSGLDHFVLRSS